jgi:drug/metabolite transporter (DMT)-like permease
MSPAALALVLSAAVFHALWNFAAKRAPNGGTVFVWLYFAASALLWIPITVAWAVVHPLHPHPVWLLGSAVSGALHIAYSLVLQRGYDHADMNLVYPLARGTGPLVTMVVSIAVLGERLGVVSIVGALVIVAGVAVIAFGNPPSHDPSKRRRGFAYGVATGLTIATYTLWDDHSVNALAIPPLPYFSIGLLIQTALLAPGVWGQRDSVLPQLRVEWREVAVVAVLSPLAYILVLQAMRLAPVALVAPARETSIVVGGLLSWLVLREPHPGRRLVGSVIVLAGIAALVAG